MTSNIYYNVSQTLLHIGITWESLKNIFLGPIPRHSNFFGVEYDLSIRFLKSFLGHSNVQQSLRITVLPVKTSIAYFLFYWHRTPTIHCSGREIICYQSTRCRKGTLYRAALLPERVIRHGVKGKYSEHRRLWERVKEF